MKKIKCIVLYIKDNQSLKLVLDLIEAFDNIKRHEEGKKRLKPAKELLAECN